MVPVYRAPDIFYQKKKSHDNTNIISRLKRDILFTKTIHSRQASNKHHRYHRDTSSNNDIVPNISVDDLLSLSFPLSEAVDFMETSKTFYIPSTQQECSQIEQTPVPITQDMDFYFNIVTVINFLTSLINAIIISICYKKCKDLLAGILTVTMDTMQQNQQVQALGFSDNELSTATNVDTTTLNSNNADYFQFSIPWIILIVFLSILLLLVLYWIFVLLIVPRTRKLSICRYLFPCHKPYGNFLTPAMDIFLDVVHVPSGEQIRVFLTTITAPPCSLSFTGSV